VVPTTPSPFLHSAYAPHAVVPPFGAFGYGGLPPAAFGTEGEGDDTNMYLAQGQGMHFLPEMFDPNFGYPPPFGWAAVPMDGYGMEGMRAAQEAAARSSGPGADAGNHRSRDQSGSGDGSAKEANRRNKGRGKDGRSTDRRGGPAADPGGLAMGFDGAEGVGRGRGGAGAVAALQAASAVADDTVVTGRQPADMPASCTTVMLRNIPNKYTREMLVKQLEADFGGLFDFLYLPIDFKNKCNVGYSFINFHTPDICQRFVTQFHGVDVRTCLPGLNSRKVVEVTPARVQGLQENVNRLRNSPVMNQLMEHPEWMPLIFDEYGQQVPFPMPDQPLPPVKPRGRNRDGDKNRG